MPIYEFYCSDCHAIFNFLARTPDVAKRPSCPTCRRAGLERRPSAFAISKGRSEEPAAGGGGDPLDDPRLERAMESMAGELEGMDENDPRGAARIMRRLYDTAGIPLSPKLLEALGRLESGEDPEAIDAELGDALDDEDALAGEAARDVRAIRRRLTAPRTDPQLYEL